ncbi:MAG: hypothetical protein IB618_00545 [Candidatus Pacearchaeota archaeon]|nr:MAG: hypothetical protein IB618_00545 [Candidatus Pacearchaeota archaeon]
MKINKLLGKVVQGIKDTAKVALYTAPFWLPGVLEAKPLDLQRIKETITKEYQNAANVKFSKKGYGFYVGMISDIGKGYHLDVGINSATQNTNGAILNKNFGLEASTDFNGNKSLTLDGMIAGTGFSARGNLASDGSKTIDGSIFRAEQFGKATIYGKVEGDKDNASASSFGFYIGPTIGNATIVLFARGSKSLTSDGYYFMAGTVIRSGKLSTSITTGTTDFSEWMPSLKIQYKF